MKQKEKPVKIGDLVQLRGRIPYGILLEITSEFWCKVNWLSEIPGQKYVHLKELMKKE